MKLINIADELTDEGLEKLKIGNLLRFKDGERYREFRVVTKNVKQKVCMVREVKTWTDEELEAIGTVT